MKNNKSIQNRVTKLLIALPRRYINKTHLCTAYSTYSTDSSLLYKFCNNNNNNNNNNNEDVRCFDSGQ